uniref:Splicing factor 3 subunit 1 n=1 Tax=Cajanus cajan TaxID=3821 RepID=A0A151U7U6_CAJCA|nr:putative splicing factor 3 subunit 1 [Cajanus cajan]
MLGSLPILPLPAPPADGNLGPLPESQVTEERTSNEEQNKSNSASVPAPATVATHTRTIGIIHPPPDIRTIVDKTAQFVAKNGPEFEKRIIANNTGNVKFNFLNSSDPYHAYYQHRLEVNNPQFHFLKPTHSMFTFFTSLADAYSKVLMPPKGLTEKLKKSVSDMTTVLERCVNRLEWERSQEQARQKAEDEIEQERIQMAMIDWHDFVVVETIDFADDEDEELPPPMTIEETTLAADDEISRNIVGLARTRPDIFGTTEEEVSNAVKAEIEKINDEQPKQVIWDGHTGSIGRTANQAMSQNIGNEDQNDASNNETKNLLGPAAPPPRPGMPSVLMAGQPPPMPPSIPMNNQGIHIPPPPGSQFSPVPEAPPPLPEEPEPKRQKLDDSALIPEDQFLAQHPGPVRISVSVPNVDEGNLKGQVLEITVQSLSETVGSLKEKIAGEIQLPANKQKLSGKPGFLKDNMSLAHYNVGGGETLTLTLRERGGRKR